MCGICGAISNGDVKDVVRTMNRTMIHRGPDSEGYLDADPIHLGARRLKIIDLNTGDQPIYNEDHTIAVVFNGEIYNFLQLYNELQNYGHVFDTHSDTEVIVHAYEEWGEKTPEHLQGMFAFAVFDGRSELGEIENKQPRLFLARDRLGIKPLYIWQDSKNLFFASELRALMSSGYIQKKLSIEGLYTYLAFGSVQEPLSIIDGIFSLPPASYFHIEFENSELQIRQGHYWSLSKPANLEPSSEEIRSWLSDAISSHLTSDVPLGAFLSGGIDSGSIVAIGSQILDKPMKTFTLGFDKSPMDERESAKATAHLWHTEHSSRAISTQDFFYDLPDALSAMDQPTVDGINSWYVSREAKRAGLTVVLSGLGGDELFAGYPSFSLTRRLKSLPSPMPWLKFLPGWDRGWPILPGLPDTRRKLAAYLIGETPLPHPYFSVRGLFTKPQIESLLQSPAVNQLQSSKIMHIWLKAVSEEVRTASQYDSVGEVSWLELSQYTRSTLLRDTDMMSMAHSLEVRVPFLDHLLVDRIMAVDGEFKHNQPYPKSMFINSVKDLLPAENINLKKRTFTFPFENWLHKEGIGKLDDRALTTLHPWFKIESLQEIEHQFTRNETNWSRPWSLYVLSEWIQRNL
ncbi:MAG: asparagine synthase (glutamine-hydrolyzing) [Chloroflexi bacterium]|nr:asparagine synthase (glutamine-hydrolyzing) [Chloroflexota bacterium]